MRSDCRSLDGASALCTVWCFEAQVTGEHLVSKKPHSTNSQKFSFNKLALNGTDNRLFTTDVSAKF